MQRERVADPETAVRQLLQSALSYPNVYERFLELFESRFGEHVTKVKGDLWEWFCILYLQASGEWQSVWRWNDVPTHVRSACGLTGRDLGIDLIAQRKPRTGDLTLLYTSVQCKYRKRQLKSLRTIMVTGTAPSRTMSSTSSIHSLPPSRTIRVRTNTLGWKELATFDAMCARTGPWYATLVMTTCDSVHRPMAPTLPTLAATTTVTTIESTPAIRQKQLVFGHRRFLSGNKSPRSMWLYMAGSQGYSLLPPTSASASTLNVSASATTPSDTKDEASSEASSNDDFTHTQETFQSETGLLNSNAVSPPSSLDKAAMIREKRAVLFTRKS